MVRAMDSEPSPAIDPSEAYVRLVTQHDRWLASYIYSLVAASADAEDLLQEVKVTLWKQFANFEPGSNFRAWARKIATNQVLNYRRSARRRPSSSLDEQFLETIAAEIDRRRRPARSPGRRAEELSHQTARGPSQPHHLALLRRLQRRRNGPEEPPFGRRSVSLTQPGAPGTQRLHPSPTGP